jgi:hypothetical protein
MFVNVIKSYRNIVAVCDSELIGKRFEEDIFQLDVKESFFKGEIKTREEAIEIMKDMKLEDSTFNIMGDRAVSAALEAGVINERHVGKIAGISYALILL